MSKTKENLMIKYFREEMAAIEYDKQTKEQRDAFLNRISFLNAVKINRNILIDTWGHILSACPENKKSNEYKIFKQVLSAYREAMRATNMLDVAVSNLLKTSEAGKEKVDMYAWYNGEIIKLLFCLSEQNQELALNTIRAIGEGAVTAQTDDDHEKEMLAFAEFCQDIPPGKKITKQHYLNFKNK